MKRVLALLLGGLGLRALFGRRREAAAVPSPADDLRARLAAARSTPAGPDAEPGEPVEPGPGRDRRAEVHERARRAIDELRGEPGDEP